MQPAMSNLSAYVYLKTVVADQSLTFRATQCQQRTGETGRVEKWYLHLRLYASKREGAPTNVVDNQLGRRARRPFIQGEQEPTKVKRVHKAEEQEKGGQSRSAK